MDEKEDTILFAYAKREEIVCEEKWRRVRKEQKQVQRGLGGR